MFHLIMIKYTQDLCALKMTHTMSKHCKLCFIRNKIKLKYVSNAYTAYMEAAPLISTVNR